MVPPRLAHSPPIATSAYRPYDAAVGEAAPSDGLAELRAELELTFREELRVRVPRMLEALERLQSPADKASAEPSRQALLDDLGRDAHSVKGGAQVVGQVEIASLAQALEAHLDAARDGSALRLREARAAIKALRGFQAGGRPNPDEIARLVADLAAG
jgi:HPt (histidine-containing phosphotransfer) domain-containing protein